MDPVDWSIPFESSFGNKEFVNLHPRVINFLNKNSDLFKNKTVLDLACHSGQSSEVIMSHEPIQVFGVDIRSDLISRAIENYKNKPICFFQNDITNYGFIDGLISESNIITCFGAFYHLTDNFAFLDHICAKNIEYVILETVFGKESPNAFLFPLFEDITLPINGHHPKYNKVAVAQPNLSWIFQSLLQIGFKIDCLEKYYQREDWENITDFEMNQRMILKLYNPNLIKKQDYLQFEDIWRWDNDNLIHEC